MFPPRRILSLWLTALAMDRHRLVHDPESDGKLLVLISHTVHGPRIEAVSRAGYASGARVGMMLSDARALCPELITAPYDSAGDHALLEELAVWALRWGPWTALDPPDGLLVDVTEVPHLFGGEERLLVDVAASFARRGLRVHAALAPTAGAAWALSHFGTPGAILDTGESIASCLANLPVAALRLDDEVAGVLKRLGIKRIGQLAGLEEGIDGKTSGRVAIQRRFRNRRSPAGNPLVRLDQLLGRIPEPLLPVVPVELPLVQRRLLEPIRHRVLLDRIVADLADDMVRELEGRGEGARRLELGLWRVDGVVAVRRLELAAPTRDAAHILRLFNGKLDDIDAGFGIEMVRLRASWSEPMALAQADFEAAAERHGTSLASCIDRLRARLGEEAVTRPVPFASHLPERAQRWQAPTAPEPASQEIFDFHSRPLKMLDKPEKIAVLYATPDGHPQRFRWRGAVHNVARVEGPERIAPEWWREKGSTRLRDYYRIEDQQGKRYWIYRCGLIGDGRGDDTEGAAPDWFLQGLCA